jgi:hypothetical protein
MIRDQAVDFLLQLIKLQKFHNSTRLSHPIHFPAPDFTHPGDMRISIKL